MIEIEWRFVECFLRLLGRVLGVENSSQLWVV